MARVFLIQEIEKYDLHNAHEFGEVIYIFNKEDRLNPMEPDQLIDALKVKMSKFSLEEDDYIALVGKMATLAIVFALFILNNPKQKYLIFDAKKSCYISRVMNTEEDHKYTFEDL